MAAQVGRSSCWGEACRLPSGSRARPRGEQQGSGCTREGLELGEGRGWQEPARGIVRKAQGKLGDLKGPHS